MAVVDEVRTLVEPLVEGDGIELVEVEHGPGLLRITLDRVGGIDLQAITSASERISAALDARDPTPGGRYTLEVTSPGLERPLRTPEHFKRFVGTEVKVKTNPGVEGDRRVDGLLSEADGDGIVVAGRRLAYSEIERARTVFEWGPTPKKSTKKSAPKKTKKKKATSE